MITDIKLNDEFVEVTGHALKVNAWDIMIDNPDRRIQATPVYRRALVHDVGDKLTVNYDGDYPGGVEIKGKTKIDYPTVQQLALNNPAVSKIFAPFKPNVVALCHVPGDVLVINEGQSFRGGVRIESGVEIKGGAKIEGEVRVDGAVHLAKGAKVTDGDLQIGGITLKGAERMPQHKTLTITSDTVLVETASVGLHGGTTPPLDLVAEILRLTNEVKILQDQIKQLQPK